jgi:predicted MFS family arabinose efflux permease
MTVATDRLETSVILGMVAMGVTAFFFVERGAGNSALVPADVLKNKAFTAASLTTLLLLAIFFAALLYLPQFMSKVLHFSALGSGAGLLPMMGTFAVTSFIAGRLYEIFGPKVIVTLGALLLGAGMFVLSAVRATTRHDYSRHGRRAVLFDCHHRGDYRN